MSFADGQCDRFRLVRVQSAKPATRSSSPASRGGSRRPPACRGCPGGQPTGSLPADASKPSPRSASPATSSSSPRTVRRNGWASCMRPWTKASSRRARRLRIYRRRHRPAAGTGVGPAPDAGRPKNGQAAGLRLGCPANPRCKHSPAASACLRRLGAPEAHAAGQRAHCRRSLPDRHGRGSSRSEPAAALLKVSGANETGEPNGPAAMPGRECQAFVGNLAVPMRSHRDIDYALRIDKEGRRKRERRTAHSVRPGRAERSRLVAAIRSRAAVSAEHGEGGWKGLVTLWRGLHAGVRRCRWRRGN